MAVGGTIAAESTVSRERERESPHSSSQHVLISLPNHQSANQQHHAPVGLSLTSIFFDSIIDILFFDSDYFDSILKNCTNGIFSHVPHYFCG